MKHIFNIALIATLAVVASVAAHEAPAANGAPVGAAALAATPAQEAFQIPAQDQTATPTSTQDEDADEDGEQSAMWGKKHHHHKYHKHHRQYKHHHGKYGHHGKHGKDKCCVKYVTITSVPECKPTRWSHELAASGAAGGDSAPIAHEAAAMMEAWNAPPPAPATW
ncbi:hypothetical protein BGZ96_001228 [Linnemannia gamsii]|uniref:Uncharacterized protein n=1 Tax=Linnemannia gamsii TaxID=64522 RepID=A0ABQ7KGD3_9FUNG|nr:hypothetical protein BGZ96_001228 [Linnemannia gamsii]